MKINLYSITQETGDSGAEFSLYVDRDEWIREQREILKAYWDAYGLDQNRPMGDDFEDAWSYITSNTSTLDQFSAGETELEFSARQLITIYRAQPDAELKSVAWSVRFWYHQDLISTEIVNYPLENHPDPDDPNFFRGLIVDAQEDWRDSPDGWNAVSIDGPFLVRNAAPRFITLHGGFGTLYVDHETGNVMRYDPTEDGGSYDHITRFDLSHWKRDNPGKWLVTGMANEFPYWDVSGERRAAGELGDE